MIKNIICDLDCTLLDSGEAYINRQKQFGELIEKETGIPKEVAIKLSKEIDMEAVVIDGRFYKERFPNCFAISSRVFDMIKNRPIDEVRAQLAYQIGLSVYDAIPSVITGTIDFLEYCKKQNWQLFIYTKGDPIVQNKKIEDSGLSQYFLKKNIYIVSKKNKDTLEHIINIHNLIKDECIVIGDSKKDDINTAYIAGIKSVWMDNGIKSGWNYDNQQTHLYDWSAKNIMEIPAMIEAYNK